MATEDIATRIASFEQWHYEFDLDGHRTPLAGLGPVRNRQTQRANHIFEPLRRAFDGSLSGKRVLDLGCNAGYFALAAVESGCEFVLGVDGRQMHIDQANFVFDVKGISHSRYEFVRGDVAEVDLSAKGPFDIVLCLGLLYHVSDPAALVEMIAELKPEAVVLDSSLSSRTGRLLELHREASADPRFALRDQFVTFPTRQAVIELAEAAGFSVVTLAPVFSSYEAAGDYRDGTRRSFLCARDPGLFNAIRDRVEPTTAARIGLTAAWGALTRARLALGSRMRDVLGR